MTYCVGVKLDEGLIFASDSRTHAGVDNYAKFCKMTIFERAGDRALVMLNSGGLAATQAMINLLRHLPRPSRPTLERRHDVRRGQPGAARCAKSSAATGRSSKRADGSATLFILGGQIAGEAMRLFRVYAEGNFIEADTETRFLQTGEAKYGKPILDLA